MDNGSIRKPPVVRELFLEALELSDSAARTALLDRVCDPTLRTKVEEMLRSYREDDFLEAPAVARVPGAFQPASIPESPGTLIGRFKILERIGEGGFGVVYAAEQQGPVRRRVALKIIKLGMDTKQVVARFEAERQALTLMDHPHIAKVLDAGATDTGRPYFVMELVRGVPITQFCEENRLTVNERLKLFVQVCQAVQHAHQKGVIHRDIKPTNVLVTLDGAVHHPVVIDFGVSKAIDQRLAETTLHTCFTQMIGTPAYMSPEQAETGGQEVDTRADVYSLGMLLYELLTGVTPFPMKRLRRASYGEIQRIICQEEPVPPSVAASNAGARFRGVGVARDGEPNAQENLTKGDLDWIALKAIDKDRARRYPTANDLATDIQRHLGNEPVHARPQNRLYRLNKSIRRNKLVFSTGAVVVAALILGTAVSSWQAMRATRASHAAEAAEQHAIQEAMAARRSLYASDVLLAKQATDASNFRRARELLERHLPPGGGAAAVDLRGWEWYWLRDQLRSGSGEMLASLAGPVFGMDISPDGRSLAVSTLAGGLKLLDPRSGREILTIDEENGMPKKPVFFRGQNRFIYNHTDRGDLLSKGFLKIWNVDAGEVEYVFEFDHGIGAKALSPDGRKALFNAPYHGLRMLDLESKNVLWETPLPHQGTLQSGDSFLFSLSSGEEFLVGQYNGEVSFYSSHTGNQTRRLQAHSGAITALQLTPDGSRLASAASAPETAIKIWSFRTLELLGTLDGHQGFVTDLDFTPDGNRLVSSSVDQTIRLWDLKGFDELAAYRGLEQEVWEIELTPDGRFVIAGGKRGAICAWEPVLLRDQESPVVATGVRCCALSAAGSRLALLGIDGSLTLGEVGEHISLKEAAFAGTDNTSVDVSADGMLLFCGKTDGSVRVYDISSERISTALHLFDSAVLEVKAVSSGNTVLAGDSGHNLALARADQGGAIALWRTAIDEIAMRPSFAFAVSPDEKTMATRNFFGRLILIDLTDGREVDSVRNPSVQPGVYGLDFSPDGRTLATADASGVVGLWDLETLERGAALKGHRNSSGAVLFLPGGNRLVSGGTGDEAVVVWDLASRQEVLRLPAEGTVVQLAYSTRWNLLIALTEKGDLHTWRAPP